jgi:two-component system CAI-1 autoinducer sensor kinase/phosphatase CqsS
MSTFFRNSRDHLANSIEKSSLYSEKNLIAIGLAGAVAFPLFYFVWSQWYPQPYENIFLRALGFVLFLPLIFIRHWPESLLKQLPSYWLITFVYTLPFFFGYMLLMNDGSPAWGMSSMAALLLLFLIVEDWILINVMFFLGNLLAWLLFLINSDTPHIPDAYMEQIPIYAFAVIVGSIVRHKSELIRQERVRVISSMGQSIAHELRTPLQGINTGIQGLNKHLPKIMAGYEKAIEHGLETPRIRQAHYQALTTLIDRLESEVTFSNSIIDMLLVNSGTVQIKKEKFVSCSVKTVIEQALQRYPFHSSSERQRVHIKNDNDFLFHGSEILFTHIIFNLTKNALWATHEKEGQEDGEVLITITPGSEVNYVTFRDNGCGIDAKTLPNIFEQFYTTMDIGKGTGVGLSFCQMVMNSFDGKIEAESVKNQYTEFKLCFPRMQE